MTILSANKFPVLGMTCQCNVKLISFPRRLLPWSVNRYLFVVWIQNFACSFEGIISSQRETWFREFFGVAYSAARNTKKKTCFVFHVNIDCKFADIFNARLTSSFPLSYLWNQLILNTSNWEEGEGVLRFSEKEVMAHITTRMVTAKKVHHMENGLQSTVEADDIFPECCSHCLCQNTELYWSFWHLYPDNQDQPLILNNHLPS